MIIRRMFNVLQRKGFFDAWSDENYLKLMYRVFMGKSLNLKNPKSFNEKMQWLKLYDRKPQYTQMVDKELAKEIVAKRWGKQYVIPTLGCWDKFDEIKFENLPKSFVLKTTHDSGGVVVVKDKDHVDLKQIRKTIENSLRKNYYYSSREWPYKNCTPKIIAEEYLNMFEGSSLIDYKLMCFNGKVKCSFTCTNRFGEGGLFVNFYDSDWKPMPFIRKYPRNPIEIPKPKNYEKMVELAEMVSKNIPFIRVDFYEYKESLFFGEFTFFPGAGLEKFYPEEWDYKLGEWLDLK